MIQDTVASAATPVERTPDSGDSLVSVEHLVKRFGSFEAVKDINFQVQEGEIFGFLGPNGAGKSTTIKVMCTILKPTSGHVRVAGYDVTTHPDAVRGKIGIVFQDTTLDSGLTAKENLDFHCMMYHIPRAERAQRIAGTLALMDLTEHKGRIVKTYSGGMRRRLEIARGLLHEPRLMILDEPTVGLDPQTRNYIWQYVRGLRDRNNTAIFMTTHYMEEAENCDRVAIIDKGVIVALDTPAELKKLVGEDQVTLVTSDNAAAAQTIADRYALTPAVNNGQITFQVADADRFLPRLLSDLSGSQASFSISSVNVRRPTLEDVFLKLTGRTIREEEGDKDERRLGLRRRGRL